MTKKKNGKKIRGSVDYRAPNHMDPKCEVCFEQIPTGNLYFRSGKSVCWQCASDISNLSLMSTETTDEYRRQLRLNKGLPPE